nr:retrovirus-related Pol polyprotein from transposon TNT 1-94 [Tanacetum cinerariifolium]
VSPDAADSGPIFDTEPLQKVSNDDHYNVFAIESEHPEQSKSVYETYPIEQDEHNKEAQIKLYKTHEDKELDKVIALENKVKVLDNIVYKTGQPIQTMSMLNNKCRTSFAKPEFLKKAQRANPRMYDIGCYNDNLALMLAPESDEDKGIAISELMKLIEKLKGKSMDTKFGKSSVIRQPNAFKSQRPSILGKPTIFSDSLERKISQSQRMYKLHTEPTQARTSQLPQDSRKTNKHVSFSTGVIPTTSVSRPQLKSNPKGDRVLRSNSQGKKLEVEEHRRNVKLLKNKMHVTACTDSLNAKTVNVKSVSALCAKCVMIKKLDVCVTKSVAKPLRKPVASESIKKPRNNVRKLNERFRKIYKWTYIKFTPSGYMWKPKSKQANVNQNVSMPLGNASRTANVKATMTSRRSTVSNTPLNDQIEPILGYGDLVQGAVTIKRVYYVEGLNHNLFSTLNVNFVCATCGKYVLNEKHDTCVLKTCNSVNSRTKMPIAVPVSTREPTLSVKQSVAKPIKKTVDSESNQKPRNITRKLYERVSKPCSWWYPKFTPSGYKWKPKSEKENVNPNVSMPLGTLVEIVLLIVDSGCLKYMTGNLKLLINFVEKFLGTVKFGNDQIAPIFGYGDLVQGVVTIKRVYYVEGLNHNLFSVSQFCDADLEVAFRKSTCYIHDLKGNDLLTDHLYSSCELGKAKRKSFHTNTTPSSKRRLQLLHMDLCGPMRVASINGKRYVLVIVDDYSRYTWTYFLRSKDETPEVLIDFLRLVQGGLHAQVRIVRIDKGTESLNKTLHAFFASEGILHQMSVARTPEQNNVVERRNRTLVEAARTMLSAAKVPLFFWDEAIATTCFTQNRSLVIPHNEKTPYYIVNDWKPSVKFFYIFGSLCYIVKDGENLDKMKEKDRTVTTSNELDLLFSPMFDELINGSSQKWLKNMLKLKMTSLSTSSVHQYNTEGAPGCQRMALEHDSFSPGTQCQENVTQADRTVTTSNELDLLFSPMFDELLNGSSKVVSKLSAVSTADAPIQQMVEEYAQVENNEFINIFCTPVQDQGETSSRHVDLSNMHTFCQHHPSEHRWTKDHPLEQVIGNPSQSVRTRRQLESDGEMCMFALTVSRTEPKTIKEAMADSAWIESMQEELYQFDRLEVWGLVDRPLCKNVINMKWLWKNKRDEENTVIRNKSRSTDPTLFITKHRGDILLIFINQAKYAQEILIKHGMTLCDSIGTLMAIKHLDVDLSGTPIAQTKYRSMVEALMYLTASRPDIMHATSYCARYQVKPTEKHLTAVKRIFRYLKDTIHMGLRYLKDTGFELTAFLDSDHAGCLDSRKSTSGGIQFLGGDKLVSWSSKKQDCTLMSSAEAEYVSLSACCAQVLWMRTQLTDYGFHFDKIPIYHFIKEKVEKGIVELFIVGTEYQLADMFTKAFPKERFKYLVRRLGMRCLTPEELEVLANESA